MTSRVRSTSAWDASKLPDTLTPERAETLRLRAFDESAVGLAVMSLEPPTAGTIVTVNAAAAGIVGSAVDELVGLNTLDFGLPEHRPERQRLLDQLVRSESSGYRLEKAIVRSDGTLAWVQVDASPVERAPDVPRCAVLSIQDVTERRNAAQRAEARVAVTRILAQSSTVDGAISALLPALASSLDFQIGAAWMLDDATDSLRSHALWRSSAAIGQAFWAVTRELSLTRGSGLLGRAWDSARPQFAEDLVGDAASGRAHAIRADGLCSAVAFPLRIGAELVGVVELVCVRRRVADDALLELLAELGEQIAEGLASKRAQEHVTYASDLLLVEDNHFIARLVGEMLAETDVELELEHVERLDAACARIIERPPACVLLDLSLPDADGLQSLLQIRKLAPEVPIVVLTGLEDADLAVRAVQEGAQDYLVKRQVDMESLARAVKYAMERKGAEQQMLEHRLRDSLTGLPNRVLLLDRLRVALARDERARLAVLLVNVDRFRVINDSLGHACGDDVLVMVAQRIVATCGTAATVAALGGDEFAVLLDDVDQYAAVRAAETLRAALKAPMAVDAEEVLLTVTVGIAIKRDHPEAEQLVAEADSALSRAKDLGGDRSEVFDEGVRLRLLERLRLESGLRNAIDRGELRLVYQPIVDLGSRAVLGFEALVRWQHPEQGLLPPGAFMAVAEESGLVVPMGAWVLDEACGQLAAWRAERPGTDRLTVNVNLSARQLGDARLVETVVAAAERHGVPSSQLALEVTETALVEDLDATLPQVAALKSRGFRLALDDFGTGYCSLSYLQRFPVDVLKLDRSFVAAMREHGEEAIVAGVAHMATALGLPPLAEGIEYEEEIARLRDLGYVQGQGFLFGRPEAPDLAIELLDAKRVSA